MLPCKQKHWSILGEKVVIPERHSHGDAAVEVLRSAWRSG